MTGILEKLTIIKLFDNIWINSIIGIIIILTISMVNLIMSRRKTMPVMILDQVFFGLIGCLFGLPCIIVFILLTIGLIYKKYHDKWYKEKAYLDFTRRIYSISGLFNRLKAKVKNKVIIGTVMPVSYKDIKNNQLPIAVDNTILGAGTLISGSSGSLKTSTIKSLIVQSLKLGHPVAFFDYKGEEDILDDLEKLAGQLNIPYYEFSARRCNFNYDPLINLNETGKIEAILNTRKWATDNSDAHYKTSSQLYIQNLVREYEMYRKQHPETEGRKNYTVGLYDYTRIYKPQASEKDGYSTTVKILEILLTSRAKELFGHDLREFSFQDNKQYIVCFSFVSANKSLASSLSSFVYQDLMDRGTKYTYNPGLFLAIDEFGTLENSVIIKDILEKGRSGGIQTVLSILDINQIAMTTSDHFVQAILGTINSAIIHAGSTKQTAELISGISKFDNEYDIMNLTKPYKGNAPTVLYISKYNILKKRGGQEVYRLIPYIDKIKKSVIKPTIEITPKVDIQEEIIQPQNKLVDLYEDPMFSKIDFNGDEFEEDTEEKTEIDIGDLSQYL